MNNPPTKSSDSRGMLVMILAVVGVVAYVFVGFLPAQKKLASKRRELREKRQFIANADLKSATVNQLDQQLQAARKHVDSWRDHSRMEAGTVVLLGELASLAAKAGVILHRVTPQDPTNLDTLRQQGLEIDIEGTYSQILEF